MPTFVENLNTRRLRWWAALVAACLLAAGCSFVRLSYDNFPSLARWEIDRYLDLDSDQEAIVTRHLEELHRWHRQEQLPQYGAFLREVDDGLRTPLDPSQVRVWRERVGAAWLPVAERLAPGLAELALTLRPAQIERMRKRLAESNDKYRKTHLPAQPGAREEARAERLVKRAVFFLGEVTDGQESELRARAVTLPASEDDWLAERQARQQRLVALLERLRREQPSRERATELARQYLSTVWSSQDPQRSERLAGAVAASDALTAAAVAQATPRQREYLSKLLLGYVQDAEALSGRSQVASADAGSRGAGAGGRAAPATPTAMQGGAAATLGLR